MLGEVQAAERDAVRWFEAHRSGLEGTFLRGGLVRLGLISLYRREYDRAIELFQKAGTIQDPGYVHQGDLSDVFLGHAYLVQGGVEQAQVQLLKALRLSSGNSLAWP